ncbi:Gfo/Idh/MocA family protein [Shewanella surugensis]|uniref:Gfo/Idh/MocA family oxidoreductase n=1 Tax=Shewanella surugensis TaxID=212020 RepID=A0ABT0L996_9GAMM|nr:Gfo/Idh/MocA family oxidoreductase [Shewanella surugensis]MCL1124292.1 Gfo/Idh/MocA family oxidoreductase [Shewanella surugensis]
MISLEAKADKYVGISCETRAIALIERADVDVIYIATPPKTHIEYCRLVLKAGKALWCEKPLAVDFDDAAAFVAELERHSTDDKLKAAVNLSLASSPELEMMQKVIAAGDLGPHLSVDIRFQYSAWPRTWQQGASSWLSGREQGGFLREVFSHFVFMHHRLLGEMQLIHGHVIFADNGAAEISVMAEYRCGDLPVRLMGAVGGSAPDVNEWSLYGEQQSLRYADFSVVKIGQQSGWQNIPLLRSQGSVASQLDEVSLMMQNKPHRLASFKEALAVQKVVEQTLKGKR